MTLPCELASLKPLNGHYKKRIQYNYINGLVLPLMCLPSDLPGLSPLYLNTASHQVYTGGGNQAKALGIHCCFIFADILDQFDVGEV